MTANFFTAMIIRSGDLIWISYKVDLMAGFTLLLVKLTVRLN
jgi:hypothetical protein